MLAGEPPYTGPTAQAIIAKRFTEPLPRLRTVREVPEQLEKTIHRALARNPADRFPTAAEFARALGQGATGASSATIRAPAIRLPMSAKTRRTVGAVLLLVAAAAVAWLIRPRRLPPPLPGQLAVLPFSVTGTGSFAYLAQGMVDLLSRNLNGVEALVTVDPGRVISAAGRDLPAQLDAARARDIARRLGAGQYILGSVVPAGGQLRIQAQLYRQDSAASPVAQATVEGDSTRLFALVDQLTAQLLAARGQGQGSRLAQTAALTTRSLPALKAYLEAERNLRAARYDSAIAGFQRAVEADSDFALAHYRLAAAAMWVGRMGLIGPAVDRALALNQRLSDRDRRLLSAFADLVRGAPDRAERQYREFLEAYPDDLEAEFQLGNLLYTYNAARGRSPAEAGEYYTRVLQVDPKFICPI
jgi:serine/threonine-protein kinase